jgi:Sulfotransferase family
MSEATQRLLFIGGLHRSGTTPLARALAGHPEISGLSDTGVREDEGQHLQTVYRPGRAYGGPGRFGADPRAHLTEASPLVTPENARALREAWDPYWDLGSRYLLEKSPPNLVMGRFLQALFPGAPVIVVVRHPVVVALSNKKWRKAVSADPRKFESIVALVEHWLTAHRIFLEDAPRLRPVHVLHYEDLVADPVVELARIQEFLDLRAPISADRIKLGASLPYEQTWASWAGATSWWRPGHWQRRAVERRFREGLASFGYELDDLSVRHRGAGPSLSRGGPALRRAT